MPTLTSLSDAKRQLLERRLRGEEAGPRAPAAIIPQRPPGVPLLISPEQGHVWLHASLAPGLPLYNESVIVHRHGPLDRQALQNSMDELLRRHEAWRTSFDTIDGEVRQVVHPAGLVELPMTDLAALPPELARQEALRIAAADVQAPIGMAEPPLFRIRLIRLSAEEHQIQFTLHHVIFDGVSVYRVLLPELAALYATFVKNEPPALPPPALQYGDYTVWRWEQISGPAMAGPLQHWRQALANPPVLPVLPFDRPRPSSITYRGASEEFHFPPGLTERLHELSRAEGTTTYMVLLAAFKTLLYRYSGQQDLIVGGLTDTRRRPELEHVVGYFLNPIALRTRPQAATPFRTYLRELRDTVLGALAASDVPFDQVLRDLRIRRDPAAHPLFSTMFSIQPPLVLPDAGWDLTQTDVFSGSAKFDLYLELDERPDGFIARAMYNAGLFDAVTIRRMAANYLTVLGAIVADPGHTLGTVPLLDEAERVTIEDAWNRTACPVPQATLHGLVREQSRRSPRAVAVRCGEHSWTYAELDREVARFAAALRQAGAGPGRVIGLCLGRSMEMVAGVLAVLNSGSAYIPLDADLPMARLSAIISDADPVLIFTQRALASSLPPGLPLLLMEDVPEAGLDPPADTVAGGQDDLAYVIFTSGTTGRPKGVEVTHRAAVNTIVGVGNALGCSAADIGIAATTLSFDVSCLDLFVPLARGAQLVVAPRDIVRDPVLLVELISSSGATMMHATPATWRRLAEVRWECTPGFKAISAGESLPRDLTDALLSRGIAVWNGYGPTEAAVLATLHEARPEPGLVPIGRPFGNVTMAILDGERQTVPIGVVGELHIGGAGLARGYRGRDDMTAERFITHQGRRLYRTGDLARYRPDGQIIFLGRADTQVKVRGFRIELDEVEGAILAHPAVAAAAVRAAPDPSGETGLFAYIVPYRTPAPTSIELRKFLEAVLPDYMVPSGFMTLDALPVSGSGKLDRAALPEPAFGRPSERGAPAPKDFADEWERRVARVWEKVLGVHTVTRDDDFFDLGGHSILVAMLQGRIVAEFGLTLSLAELFRAQTVSRLARLLRTRGEQRASPAGSLWPIQPAGSAPPLYWVEPTPSVRLVADALGRRQPVLGLSLEAADFDALGPRPSVEAVAACLVRILISEAPVGPYQLMGFCNKGVLAFEVASQLRAAGCEVPVIINLDGGNPAATAHPHLFALQLAKLRFHLARAWRLSGRSGLRYASDRAASVLTRAVPVKPAPRTREERVDDMLARGFLDYTPKPYDGTMAMLQVGERPEHFDIAPSWASVVTGRLTQDFIPGTHQTLFEPGNMQGFADAIQRNLVKPGHPAPWPP